MFLLTLKPSLTWHNLEWNGIFIPTKAGISYMSASEIIAILICLVALLPTLASLTKFDQWWVRAFDFPRLQVSTIIIFAIIYVSLIFSFAHWWHYLLVALLSLSFLYQAKKIFPYTILARKQVYRFQGKNEKTRISVLVSNVLTPNKQYQKLIDLINKWDPDLVLTLESDKKWEKELDQIEYKYPYSVKIPQDNLYGMHLYSKLELDDIEVKYLISEEIPSIHGKVILRDGQKINIYCLHPKPPSPTEDETSTNRDAELLLVGKEVDHADATLVFGDLNDVAWSRTTRLFQKLSGLADPRIGRGFFNTYNANIPIFRWPLDHVFHSLDFSLVEIKRLPAIGSDHFPIFIDLNYKTGADQLNDEPEQPLEEEKEWAEEKIEKGR